MNDLQKSDPIRQIRQIRQISQISQISQIGRIGQPGRSEVMLVVTTAVYQLSAAAGELPSVGMTLPVAEAVHRALIRKAASGQRVDCPELTGQDRHGQPLTRPHEHAHILPVDADQDGTIDHVIVYAAMGLGPIARSAIASLTTLFGNGGRAWLRLRAADNPDDLPISRRIIPTDHRCDAVDRENKRLNGSPPADRYTVLDGSTDWVSLTPLVAPRFLKRSGKNSLVGQILSELASRKLPEAKIEVLSLPASQYRHFILARDSQHAPPPQRLGHAVRLRFCRPVLGPIALGYGSHFGLGLFQVDG